MDRFRSPMVIAGAVVLAVIFVIVGIVFRVSAPQPGPPCLLPRHRILGTCRCLSHRGFVRPTPGPLGRPATRLPVPA